mgnify:CR=1 FL=1
MNVKDIFLIALIVSGFFIVVFTYTLNMVYAVKDMYHKKKMDRIATAMSAFINKTADIIEKKQ